MKQRSYDDGEVLAFVADFPLLRLKFLGKTYYDLVKPGIVYANVLMALSGFLLATRMHGNWAKLTPLLLGTGLIIASACVFNNYLDRELDAKMKRTRRRALVMGTVSVRNALLYACGLGAIGFMVLAGTNGLTMLLGVVAMLSYVAVYGIAKRRTAYGTLVGAVPGAASLVAGYSAATGRLDVGALILFLIMATWQVPHFYAIAIYRLRDYVAAGLPVWPAAHGVRSARLQIVAFISLFTLATLLLTVFGYTGYVYAAVMLALGGVWLGMGLRSWRTLDSGVWAKKMFLLSLVVLSTFAIVMPLGTILP